MADFRVGGAFQPDALYDMNGGGFIGATMIGMNAIRRILRLFLPSPFKLESNQSGALCLFDSPTGGTFVLPKPDLGLSYDFAVVTPLTSGMNIVQTDSPSTYLVGMVATGSKNFRADGTTHTKLSMNSSTTGAVTLTCLTPNKWGVSGNLDGTGLTTPFMADAPAKPDTHAKPEAHAKAEKV